MEESKKNVYAFRRDVVICKDCELDMVLEEDGTLPIHWPTGFRLGQKPCGGFQTRNFTRDKDAIKRRRRAARKAAKASAD